MSIDSLKDSIPEYAKDQRLNLSTVTSPEHLSEEQALGVALASAYGARNAYVQQMILAEAQEKLNSQEIEGIKAAASIMGMNNIYYRFLHLTPNEAYKKMPAGLRMNIIKNHGIDDTNFEMYSFAVSVINACEMCVGAHENALKKNGMSEEAIQSIVKIASVIHAIAVTVEAEQNTESAAQKAA